MCRPQGSDYNKRLGLIFASAVTASSSTQESEGSLSANVVRSGPHLLYEVFSQVYPSATRANARDGLTLFEFNKVLHKVGWTRVKFRASARQIADGHIEGTSFYQIGGRRWRDPDDADDMAALAQVWPLVGARAECSLPEIARVLREAIEAEAAFKAKGQKVLRLRWVKRERESQQGSLTSSACSEADTNEPPTHSRSCPVPATSSESFFGQTASCCGSPFAFEEDLEDDDTAESRNLRHNQEQLHAELSREPFSAEDPADWLAREAGNCVVASFGFATSHLSSAGCARTLRCSQKP